MYDPSVNEFLDKDKDGISINQKWNSTIQKNAQNIKECGFPVDVSSIKLCQSGSSKFLSVHAFVHSICIQVL